MSYTYELQSYSGVDSCELCDTLAPVYDYLRSDGKACLICHKCSKDIKVFKVAKYGTAR